MTSTFVSPPPKWCWPREAPTPPTPNCPNDFSIPGGLQEEDSPTQESHQLPHCGPSLQSKPSRRHWPPRTCRICLETVTPTFHPPVDNIPGMFQHPPWVTYDSAESEAGRLLRPCKCKGSSKYVHEGCLQAWRHADPEYGKRNYWQCPTCGFRYRLERMRWGRWVSSTVTQITLTVSIFLMSIFFMGFVADPIINIYADPYSVISSAPLSKMGDRIESDDDIPTWTEHFIKGLASLGLVGFLKVLFAFSPWQWWNIRNSGIMGGAGRSGNSGRDRMASISWIVVLIGIGTFLWVCDDQALLHEVSTKNVYRLSIRVFVLGVAELWRKLERGSWMWLERKTMITKKMRL